MFSCKLIVVKRSKTQRQPTTILVKLLSSIVPTKNHFSLFSVLYGNKITHLPSRLFEGLTSLQLLWVDLTLAAESHHLIHEWFQTYQRKQDRVHQTRHVQWPNLPQSIVSPLQQQFWSPFVSSFTGIFWFSLCPLLITLSPPGRCMITTSRVCRMEHSLGWRPCKHCE